MDEYFGILLAFIAVLASIFGDTWNKDNTGHKKLLPLGKFILILAICSFIYNLTQTYQARKEKEFMKIMATTSLKKPLIKLLTPLENLLFRANRSYNGKSTYQIMDADKDTFFFYLNSKEFKESLIKIKVKELRDRDDSTETWMRYIQTRTEEAKNGLESILTMYSKYLDNETVLIIYDVLNDNTLNRIIQFKPVNKVGERDPFGFPYEESDFYEMMGIAYPSEQYSSYLKKVKRLYDAYQKAEVKLKNK